MHRWVTDNWLGVVGFGLGYGLEIPPPRGPRRGTGSASVGFGSRSGDGRSAVPAFVPARFREIIARAAERLNVGAGLLVHAQ
jgi:hypothetical protein